MRRPRAEAVSMAVRLAALLPRAVVVVLIWVLGTAAFTFAADTTIISPSTPTGPAVPARTPDLVVPIVTGQAYVFAKGILEDAGFAWRVAGSVRGYAGNRVLAQSPAAGTRVANTGAPTIVLHLVRGPYGERGTPADFSPYLGTPVRLANLAATVTPATPAKKPAGKPKAKPMVKPERKAVAKPAKKPARKHAKRRTAPMERPPAFRPTGAPREPLDEISLPARALRLQAWVAAKPQRTSANVQHWLYQHAWIVTGAKFGWWHGDRALVTLIEVDRRIEGLWGIGHRSEAVARAELVNVRRQSK
jgi:PASTA domain